MFRFLKTTLKYLGIFLVIYTVINWWRQPVMPANPNLQMTDYQGQTIDLAQMSTDKPTLVYFWGSWCGVCKMTTPKVNQLAQDGYSVVSIAVQSGSNADIANYMSEHDYQFSVINDNNGDIFADWQGQVTPSYVVLNNGEMKQGLTGIQPLWSLKLRLWLSQLF